MRRPQKVALYALRLRTASGRNFQCVGADPAQDIGAMLRTSPHGWCMSRFHYKRRGDMKFGVGYKNLRINQFLRILTLSPKP